jgi:hypothetical protein
MRIEAFRHEEYDVEGLLAEMAECSSDMAEAADIIRAAQARHTEHLARRIELSEALWQRIFAECNGDVWWARARMHELQASYYADSPVAGDNQTPPHLHTV